MNSQSRRPLSLTNLRAFEAVARRLSFGAAADELHLTQSAISRQIKGLEDELGAQPVRPRHPPRCRSRPTARRCCARSSPGSPSSTAACSRSAARAAAAGSASTTFASFGSLWLLPRIEAFQRDHPDIDIRVSAHDAIADLDDPELDLALRYLQPGAGPAGRGAHVRRDPDAGGEPRPLGADPPAARRRRWPRPADLAQHTLAEEDDDRPSTEFLSWRHWLAAQGQPDLQPRRWLYLNFTYQQVQAALAGHGVALARVPLVFEALQRGELVEPFGAAGRVGSPFSYWMLVAPASRARSEVLEFAAWVEAQAAATRAAVETSGRMPPRPPPAAASARPAR